MNIWIRTQDRNTLIFCDKIHICPYNRDDKEGKYAITTNIRGLECLGVYKSRLRAIEVLHKIEDYIVSSIPIPFYMPEE